jgi:hypothetical protein
MGLLDTTGRHKGVQDAARRFDLDHLTNPDARQIAMACGRLAQEMLARISRDDPELTNALNRLADARDAFIRAKIYTGRG